MFVVEFLCLFRDFLIVTSWVDVWSGLMIARRLGDKTVGSYKNNEDHIFDFQDTAQIYTANLLIQTTIVFSKIHKNVPPRAPMGPSGRTKRRTTNLQTNPSPQTWSRRGPRQNQVFRCMPYRSARAQGRLATTFKDAFCRRP